MYHDFGNNLEANLEVFVRAEASLRNSLDDQWTVGNADGGSHWIEHTDMAIHEDEYVRLTYLAWREARTGIDSVRERIAEKDEKDKAEKST